MLLLLFFVFFFLSFSFSKRRDVELPFFFFFLSSCRLPPQLRQEASEEGSVTSKIEEMRKATADLSLKSRDVQKSLAESMYRLRNLDDAERVRHEDQEEEEQEKATRLSLPLLLFFSTFYFACLLVTKQTRTFFALVYLTRFSLHFYKNLLQLCA